MPTKEMDSKLNMLPRKFCKYWPRGTGKKISKIIAPKRRTRPISNLRRIKIRRTKTTKKSLIRGNKFTFHSKLKGENFTIRFSLCIAKNREENSN